MKYVYAPPISNRFSRHGKGIAYYLERESVRARKPPLGANAGCAVDETSLAAIGHPCGDVARGKTLASRKLSIE
jgi:hypothetical protein